MSARENILARLRNTPLPAAPALPEVAAWYATYGKQESMQQRTARLRTALQAVHTEVHDSTLTSWPDQLLAIAADKKLRNLLIGADTPHGAVLEARQAEHLKLLRYSEPIESWRDLMFDGVDAAVTLARSAIADTGSLILWPTPNEPRLMSLVPHVHFVLLDPATIHPDFYSALSAEGWKDSLPTNALLICGPSKTADIQQTLAYGAHGPRELVVLLLHPEGVQS